MKASAFSPVETLDATIRLLGIQSDRFDVEKNILVPEEVFRAYLNNILDIVIGTRLANRWIVGTGIPTANRGEPGDLYLDGSNGNIYGPKIGEQWGPIVGNIRGATGQDGASQTGGGGVNAGFSLPFSFGDATPFVLPVIPPNKLIANVKLIILNAFDGDISSLSIGTGSDPNLIFSSDEVDTSVVAEFEITPYIGFDVATPLFLYITPGFGALNGNGLVQLEFAP